MIELYNSLKIKSFDVLKLSKKKYVKWYVSVLFLHSISVSTQ